MKYLTKSLRLLCALRESGGTDTKALIRRRKKGHVLTHTHLMQQSSRPPCYRYFGRISNFIKILYPHSTKLKGSIVVSRRPSVHYDMKVCRIFHWRCVAYLIFLEISKSLALEFTTVTWFIVHVSGMPKLILGPIFIYFVMFGMVSLDWQLKIRSGFCREFWLCVWGSIRFDCHILSIYILKS